MKITCSRCFPVEMRLPYALSRKPGNQGSIILVVYENQKTAFHIGQREINTDLRDSGYTQVNCMNNWTKTFIRVNAFIYEKTKGRLGSRLGKQSVLLLHTTGRKSGKIYTTPLSYYRDGETYLLVASNWGKENNPNWYQNLLEHPSTTIQVEATTIPVVAQSAQGDEYKRLWELVTAKNTQYMKYQKDLTRQIPIMILTPKSSS